MLKKKDLKTLLKYSISETARIGGKLNWINANSLNEKIIKQLEKIKIQILPRP